VTERVPVAAVAMDDGVALVDAHGVELASEPKAPGDLPLVSASTVDAGDRPLQAATSVLESLTPELRAQVKGTEALTHDSVTLTLRSGAKVVWGSPEDSTVKAEVLAVLLQTPADVYDVSAPGTPVTR
jgi:cell division protein FtsQ